MFIDNLKTNSLTLGNGPEDAFEPVVSLALGTNNVKPMYSQKARLAISFAKNFPAEIEIEPGPECIQPIGSSIISEVMIWGKVRKDRGRNRVTLQINVDEAGGEYALLDSTTNDKSGSAGQDDSMPILINRGEANGVYIGLYPENVLLLADRKSGRDIRLSIEKIVALFSMVDKIVAFFTGR